MHVGLVAELQKKYPVVYSSLKRAECGNGWYFVLDALGEGLSAQAGSQPVPSILIFKEKFGILRFGKILTSPEQKGLFVMATLLSARICEVCGSSGCMQNNGRRIRCPVHEHILDATGTID